MRYVLAKKIMLFFCQLHTPPFNSKVLCFSATLFVTWCNAVMPAMLIRSTSMSTLTFNNSNHARPQTNLSAHPPQHRHDCLTVALLDALLKHHLHTLLFTLDNLNYIIFSHTQIVVICYLEKHNIEIYKTQEQYFSSKKFKWNSPKCSSTHKSVDPHYPTLSNSQITRIIEIQVPISNLKKVHTSSGNLTRRLPGFCLANTLARRDMPTSL